MTGEFPQHEIVDEENAARIVDEISALFAKAEQMLADRPKDLPREADLASLEVQFGKVKPQLEELRELAGGNCPRSICSKPKQMGQANEGYQRSS